MNKPQARVRVDFAAGCSIGPGKISLLEHIGRTGSLSAAARELGMSYRRAWLLLHATNDAFVEPVAELAAGGKDGGGARLTDFGRRLIGEFRCFEQDVDHLALQRFSAFRASGQTATGQGLSRRAGAARVSRRAVAPKARPR